MTALTQAIHVFVPSAATSALARGGSRDGANEGSHALVCLLICHGLQDRIGREKRALAVCEVVLEAIRLLIGLGAIRMWASERFSTGQGWSWAGRCIRHDRASNNGSLRMLSVLIGCFAERSCGFCR